MIPKPTYKPRKKSRKGAVQRRMDAYRAKHKMCEWCKVWVSEHTHHIYSVGMGGAPEDSLLHSELNFAALCPTCHERMHVLGKIGQAMLFQGIKKIDVLEAYKRLGINKDKEGRK